MIELRRASSTCLPSRPHSIGAEEWGTALSVSPQAPILAGLELFRRLSRAELELAKPLERPDLVARCLYLEHYVPEQEVLGLLMLDAHNRLIDDCVMFRGMLSRAAVVPRAIQK